MTSTNQGQITLANIIIAFVVAIIGLVIFLAITDVVNDEFTDVIQIENNVTLFSDDFNRADNNTLGNNWTETGSASHMKIQSNRLRVDIPGSGVTANATNTYNTSQVTQLAFLFTDLNPFSQTTIALEDSNGVTVVSFDTNQSAPTRSKFTGCKDFDDIRGETNGEFQVTMQLFWTNNTFTLNGKEYPFCNSANNASIVRVDVLTTGGGTETSDIDNVNVSLTFFTEQTIPVGNQTNKLLLDLVAIFILFIILSALTILLLKLEVST